MLLPSITLILFLIIASYHFGKEDTQFLIDDKSYFTQILYFCKGLLIILAPLYFHFQETIAIFKLLLIDNEMFYLSLNFIETNKVIHLGIICSTLSSIFLFLKNFEIKKFVIFLDYFSILILNYFLSPLIAFTVYFCFLHSIRHSISLAIELDPNSVANGFGLFAKKALPLTILTGLFSFIALYLLTNSYNLDSAILKVIFIGLASLTFPHILLEYFLEKNEK
jgi:Brp/Blh family beta-carotene 15,15'-monooxygenase